jgi:hypothetical protein
MLERTTLDTGGVSYMDIRFGEGHGIPVLATGLPVSGAGQSAYGIIGPEAQKLGSVNRFGNMIFSGPLNRDAIEANLGRVLSANELSAIATGLPAVVLR